MAEAGEAVVAAAAVVEVVADRFRVLLREKMVKVLSHLYVYERERKGSSTGTVVSYFSHFRTHGNL